MIGQHGRNEVLWIIELIFIRQLIPKKIQISLRSSKNGSFQKLYESLSSDISSSKLVITIEQNNISNNEKYRISVTRVREDQRFGI